MHQMKGGQYDLYIEVNDERYKIYAIYSSNSPLNKIIITKGTCIETNMVLIGKRDEKISSNVIQLGYEF